MYKHFFRYSSLFCFFIILFYNLKGSSISNHTKHLDSLLVKSKQQITQSNTDSAIYYARKSIEYSKQLPSSVSNYYLCNAYNIIGAIYLNIKEFETSKTYLLIAETYSQKSDSLAIKFKIKMNLASLFVFLEDMNTALKYFNESNIIGKKSKNKKLLFTSNYNLSTLYISLNKPKKALPYLKEAEEYSNISKDSLMKSNIHFTYAEYYQLTNQNLADEYFKNAIKLHPYKNSDMLKYMYKHYFNYLQNKHQFPLAIQQLQNYIALLEQDNKASKSEYVNQIENFYKKKDIENELEKQELKTLLAQEKAKINEYWVYFSISIIIVIIICLLFLYNQYKKQLDFSTLLKVKNIELEQSRNSAEELAQLKTQFSDTVTHELRTPLHGIIGLTSILIDDEHQYLTPAGQKHLLSLKSSGDYLLNLINDVLEISKIETKNVEIEQNPFNLNFLVSNLKSSFQYLIEKNNINFIVEFDSSIPELLIGDPIRLSQIVINLVGNAMKFTQNGSVFFRIKCLNKDHKICTLHFEIEDTGIGISDENQNIIFDKFSQVNNSTGNKSGTGLGLSIVKQLLYLFNSSIHLKSELNKGSMFWFDVSFEIGQANDKINNSQIKFEHKTIGQKILVIDDNEINLIVTERLLSKYEFNITTFDNGYSALQAIESEHFDLILIDLHMPKMDGIETTQQIRLVNNTIPIILLTASNITDTWNTIKQNGFNDYVIKPYEKYDFLQKITKHLK